MAAARAAVPGYDELQALEAELRKRAAAGAITVREAIAHTAAVRVAIVDRMVDTGEVPDEPEVAVREAAAAEAGVRERAQLYEAAAAQIARRRDQAVREHHHEAFAVLAGELQALMETVRELGELPRSAEEAIASERVEAFKTIQECIARYNVVRSTWASLWAIVGAPPAHTAPVQWLKPGVVLEWHPPTQRRRRPDGPRDGDGRVVARQAWPGWTEEPATGPWPVPHADQLSWLIWAAHEDALWAPSPRELEAASAAVADAVSAAVAAANKGQPVEDAVSPRRLAMAAANSAEKQQRQALRRVSGDD